MWWWEGQLNMAQPHIVSCFLSPLCFSCYSRSSSCHSMISTGLTFLKNLKLILYFQRHQALKWLRIMALFLILETKAIRDVTVPEVRREVKMIPIYSLDHPLKYWCKWYYFQLMNEVANWLGSSLRLADEASTQVVSSDFKLNIPSITAYCLQSLLLPRKSMKEINIWLVSSVFVLDKKCGKR